uniref:PNP_UDP_1 domain-containing protein n=1 Tax=Angiostrongylus cantonensis TaxID=6313 RepID=A0A158P634_ANGCA
MKFFLGDDVDLQEGRSIVHNFFKQLMTGFPKDYVSFMMRVLKMMHQGFPKIQRIDIDFNLVSEEELVAIPDAAQYDSGSEVEEVTIGHIQELLEHAFPNGLTVAVMTDALRSTTDEVERYLNELEALGIAQRVEDEWLRVDTRNVDAVARTPHGPTDQPTVAIVTCLFVEKQAVDALIEDRSMVHRYKSGGDSNIYTLGRIGQHRVVATKLASIGDSREAITSAGSITTRLLGNFQNIEHVFVVGVGGAVPHFTDAKRHARLGDVVISASKPDAYIYAPDLMIDRKTEAFSGFFVRRWNPADHLIERIVADGGDELMFKWNEATDDAVRRLSETSADFDFSMPAPETDVLALPVGGGNVVVVPHPNQDTRKGPEVHLGSIGAMANFKRHVEENEESIGALRAKFAEEFEVRCIDAGFDSVIAAINGSRIDSWALIRGIADYQHGLSRASRLWQAHSAARAAAMLRVIVERLPPP